jgi:hypothetical protein
VLTLFAAIAAIYVAECVYWIDTGAMVLTGVWRGRWRARLGPAFTVGSKGGAFLAPLLPPLATLADWPSPAAASRDATLSRKAVKEAAKRLDVFFETAGPVWISCNALWLFLFVITPPVVVWRGLASTWPVLILLLVGFLALILAGFWQAHAALYPEARAERRSKTLLMAVSPLGAIRAVDHLARRVLVECHPLVAAQALCGEAATVRLARWIYFAPGGADPALKSFLQACDLWSVVNAPPQPPEPASIAFCPRCHAQYVRMVEACADCRSVALHPLAR